MPDPNRQLADDLLTGRRTISQVAAQSRTPPIQSQQNPSPAPLTNTTPPPNTPIPQKPPTITSTPDTARKFPCKQCGARVEFDPAKRALVCPYCGHIEKIDPSQNTKIQEHDFQSSLAKQQMPTGTIAGRNSEIRCPGCGAMVLLEDNVITDKCPFCATFLDRTKATQSASQICPESLLPFHLNQQQAIAKFNQWIANLWFAPNNLKSLANLGQLSGVYVPYWTYDSMTYTHYTGERGDDYCTTETYTDYENGKPVTRTREVKRTRWSWVSGEVDHFFDDILVCASTSLPQNYVTKLEPWDLEDLEPFRTEFLSGFKTERYTVDLGTAFTTAQQIMDRAIRSLCEQDIGGDHQRLSSLNTQHVGVTYKHILLPLWLAVYRYQNQTYRILINARTGEVTGTHPWSAIKITLAILAAIALIALILFFIARAQHPH